MAGEGLLGRRPSDAGAAAGTSAGGSAAGAGAGEDPAGAAQAAAAGGAREAMLLLDGVPQQAYARIKLCRWAAWWG